MYKIKRRGGGPKKCRVAKEGCKSGLIISSIVLIVRIARGRDRS